MPLPNEDEGCYSPKPVRRRAVNPDYTHAAIMFLYNIGVTKLLKTGFRVSINSLSVWEATFNVGNKKTIKKINKK